MDNLPTGGILVVIDNIFRLEVKGRPFFERLVKSAAGQEIRCATPILELRFVRNLPASHLAEESEGFA